MGFGGLGGGKFGKGDSFIGLPCAEMRWESPTALAKMCSRTADVKKALGKG